MDEDDDYDEDEKVEITNQIMDMKNDSEGIFNNFQFFADTLNTDPVVSVVTDIIFSRPVSSYPGFVVDENRSKHWESVSTILTHYVADGQHVFIPRYTYLFTSTRDSDKNLYYDYLLDQSDKFNIKYFKYYQYHTTPERSRKKTTRSPPQKRRKIRYDEDDIDT